MEEIKKPSVDDILSGSKEASDKPVTTSKDESSSIKEKEDNENRENKSFHQDDYGNDPVSYESNEDKDKSQGEKVDSQDESDTDEFGSQIKKQKVYTEEEVNQMIRRRLKEGEAPNKVKEEVSLEVQTDPETDWEGELEGFVKQTIAKMGQEEKLRSQQQREAKIKAEFEDKFMRGMGRYGDFQDVVKGKPITDTMLLATRAMKDPAAFIYAASKTQSKELERIAKIDDPYHQVVEIGRLEERMRKVRKGTKAPAPLQDHKGDVENTNNYRRSVDDLILGDAKKKLTRRY